MCGRFTLATPQEILEALFDAQGDDDGDQPRYNIAPQTRILTVRPRKGGRRTQSLLWGVLRPGDPRPVINARSETVSTSPLFSRGYLASRLLVPADGFYEWTRVSGERRARYFLQLGGQAFGMAGIGVASLRRTTGAGVNHDEDAAVILTAKASDSISPYHDRMPCLVPSSAFKLWLDPDATPKALADVLARSTSQAWISHPVSPFVNNVRNDGPDCVRAVDESGDRQGSLF